MAKLENLEVNKVKLTFEITPEQLEKGINQAYNKNKGKINLPGFRKGKVPRKIIENYYGKGFFYEDAINFVLPEAYEMAVKEHDLETVSSPEIDVESISNEDGAIVTAAVFLRPQVSIEDYKGLTYPKIDETATEEEINKEIQVAVEQNARVITITDRPSQMDDTLTIDFEGFIDGIPFEGGLGENYELLLGSKTFIDNFEEQLTGYNVGDYVEVNVIFPGEYGKEELQNKPALFKVTIHEIKHKEFPNIDDEFAQDVSEFDTLEQYKNNIAQKIEASKKENAAIQKENAVMEKIVNNSVLELPEVMVEKQLKQIISDFERRISSQGLNIEMYLKYVGQTMDDLKKMYYPQARTQVIGRLALEAIAAKENMTVTDEELSEELEMMAKMYKMPKAQLEKAILDEDKKLIEKDILTQKAMKLVIDSAIEE